MTTVYFIRHAESDLSVRDDAIRPLTQKGMADRALVTEFLKDKAVTAVLSSPFKRAVDTVGQFAALYGFSVETDAGFRERKSDSSWLRSRDFWPFIERQWQDFTYKYSDGEHLKEVQERNIAALNRALAKYENGVICIGTHGTALSTIIRFYDPAYGFADFMEMVHIMPWVVKMTFRGTDCLSIEKINLFAKEGNPCV